MKEKKTYFILLRDNWKTTDVEPKDKINVIVEYFNNEKEIVVDDKINEIIIFPDTIVSVTSIQHAYGLGKCNRRGVLKTMTSSVFFFTFIKFYFC